MGIHERERERQIDRLIEREREKYNYEKKRIYENRETLDFPKLIGTGLSFICN